jgi:uncharacterized protein (TIGR03437 family)
VAPSTVALNYVQGSNASLGNQPVLAITGPDGSWTSSITYATGASGWLSLSPSSGFLPVNNQIKVLANPTGLATGNYQATIAFNTAGGSSSVTVNLSVVSGALLIPNPGSAVFFYQTGTAAPAGQAVFMTNSDGSPVTATVAANDPWVSVQQQVGATSFSIFVDPTGKTAGVYTSSVTITESGVNNNPFSYPVVLVVNGGGVGGTGTLVFVPSGLSFTSNNGTVPATQNLSVQANVSTTFTVTSNQSWLTVSPTAGTTPTNITVQANPTGMANGTYNGTLTFNSNGNIQNVNVSLTITNNTTGGGNVTVTCVNSCASTQPGMSFTGQTGAGPLPVGALSVVSASGSAQVAFTVQTTTTSGGSWLSTTVGNTTVNTPFNPLTVNVNVGTGASALAPGTYNGNIAITPTNGTTVNVPVTLTVTAPPTVSASPTQLNFSFRAGDPNPTAQNISVTGGSGLAFSVTVSPSGSWLAATPLTGTTPGTVAVSVNPGSLTAGTYSGTVTIAGTGGATGSTTVNVTLTVTAPLPTVARVVNAASYQANAISPGEIITLFASDASHPIGPTTPVGLQLDSTGKVSTTLGGVQVLVNGFLAPLIYVSSTQVSAVVPYEIAPLVSASVLVKYLGQSSNGVPVNVATTSPGIFTLNSSGTGPGAILNQNGTTNSPNNPANRGDTIAIYLTGEGQTSPPGVTGKVTVANSTPPFTPGPLLPIGITIGGQPANYSFAGEAPQLVSGVMQLNVQIPLTVGAGDQALVVSIGGPQSQTGVTVSVR